jgi:hypothetical protein
MVHLLQVQIKGERKMEMKQLLISVNILLCFIVGCGGDSGRATQSVLPTPPEVIYTPGEVITDSQGYVSYRVGNTPIIITVPHDGTIEPSTLPDRNGEITRAVNTRKLAEQFAYFFNKNSNGLFPHIIYNNLSRTKLDPDLNLTDGAQGNSSANTTYGNYHGFLQTAIDTVEANFDSGILLNLVEHTHSNQRVELGYLLTENNLSQTDSQLNSLAPGSSIAGLSVLSSSSFAEIVRGYSSLGSLIISDGQFDAVPTMENPNVDGEDYISGGYTLTTYGSHNLSTNQINAINVATPYAGFRDNANAYRALAIVIERSVKNFYESNLGLTLY